jgi:hypothetical protein
LKRKYGYDIYRNEAYGFMISPGTRFGRIGLIRSLSNSVG